ncbi:BZ3500_MvSof-1268-A1-R1_Chr2-3g05240 [Microbotryum saponariae]|uniref:BZ3500_MvSof-1268-A1-R1_Chr2-3g05240 protein n=1 Tax=Microbotryum saponariae TaxID=289078 RepID=A0A2X0N7B1_9BASI|nr:BZ3500_MvSof-1268-A1-R1_Chr2-3g05240 [Microbotryum saponariae]SDA01066.1 BZ3501_MvSof-1269-A2-R1_Chr2-2g04913 [Microbotryum saponariae]
MNPSTSRRRSSTPPSSPPYSFSNGHHEPFGSSLSQSTSKRPTLSTVNSGTNTPTEQNHYDIYCIPCTCPCLSVPQTTAYPSASFLIVHRQSGMATGLGVRFGIQSSSTSPEALISVVADPGFSLHREPGFDKDKAVLLGWVEQERLGFLEQIIRAVEIRKPQNGREMLDWLLAVARVLEYEGIAANGELLLGDILDARTA